MESGIDPGQDYYTQDYYNYDHGYDLPQYGSRRKLISPSGLYDEYGEVVVDDDGSYYYSPQESEAEGSRKRRIKLVFDREYETSSTGEESLPETQRSRFSSTHNSHVNVNGGLYVAQNGSIIRTRRSVTTAGSTHTTATVTTTTSTMNNNLKLSSPVFSSRLTKHFKKLDKMAATLEERVPLNISRTAADGGRIVLRTFQGAGTIPCASATATTTTTTSSFTHTDSIKTLNVFNTRQSSVASGSNSTSNAGPESGGTPSTPPQPPPPPPLPSVGHEGGVEEPPSTADSGPEEGERESKVDEETEDNNNRHHHGHVSPLECPSDRTQSDEEELWMGPWNSLHIPMTKL